MKIPCKTCLALPCCIGKSKDFFGVIHIKYLISSCSLVRKFFNDYSYNYCHDLLYTFLTKDLKNLMSHKTKISHKISKVSIDKDGVSTYKTTCGLEIYFHNFNFSKTSSQVTCKTCLDRKNGISM